MRFRRLPFLIRAGIRGLLSLGPTARIRRWSTILGSDDISDFYAQQCGSGVSSLVHHPPARLEWESIAQEVREAFDDDAWQKISQAMDFSTFLPDDLLVKVDRASMAVALEARVPLLDHRFVEFAARIPHEMKFRNKTTKFLLKRVLAKYVPRELWERPKRGFAIPLGQWFQKELKPWVLDELTGNWDWTLGIIDRVQAERFIRDHLAGHSDYTKFIWAFLAVKTWSRRIGLVR
jgi:asparagine synthetase B (glutamine-hydrolysing)